MHHIRDPVTLGNDRNSVAYVTAPQDERPAWNQAQKLIEVGAISPPSKFTATPEHTEQANTVCIQAPPHQLLYEPTFVLLELPRSRSNLYYPPPSIEQPKIVNVQAPATLPRSPAIVLHYRHLPKDISFRLIICPLNNIISCTIVQCTSQHCQSPNLSLSSNDHFA